ncbi:arylphorin-like [Anticarsia gemmatalis]|uniref:arylphorin-like n=1 Tax=Anticarsia gemmatalis TaxID=129554 RepID=UPI003F7696DA
MKTVTLVLVVSVVITHISGYLIKVPTAPVATPTTTTGHTQWVQLQKLVLPLFENVCEISSYPTIRRLAQEFTFDSTGYTEPEVITNLQNIITKGLLPKGTIFTEYDSDHMKELKIVYEVLYNANDFDTFYKAAAWARQNLNCVLYVNALYMAILNRRDTERLSIPAPYELIPNYFIDKDVIIQASTIFAGEDFTPSDTIRDEGNAYTIDANYTALFYDNDDDSKLAYFREDVGLNTYYFLRKLKLAPWFNDDVNGNFGENMYQMMKQFMARYNLERYANGLPEIDSVNWNSPSDIPYDPMLIYSDGNEFSHRTSTLDLPVNEDLQVLQTIENNIIAIVSHMRQSGYTKAQILNHLMEILVTGDRSYETLARQLLGKDLTNNGHASVLEHYMTSLRDPMFWKINKKIVDMVDEALKVLLSYERNELYFPGVEVVNIEVKKMMTTFDYFEFDVTDALKIEGSNSMFKIKIGQPRLNHKQFTLRVNVSSLVSQKGLMKIYLGPKLMPGELAAKKNLFTLLDAFDVNLRVGSNLITRSSENMKQFSEDFMLLNNIRKNVEDAEFGLDSLPLKTIESQIGYPSRLILPKGTSQGLPLQMFVFIAPYIKASIDSTSRNNLEINTAILSPGYPLDLMIDDRALFGLPNAMIKYVVVGQKGDSKVENYGGPGVTKLWYTTDTYEPSLRPTHNSWNTTFDYKAKKAQYNKKDTTSTDYSKYKTKYNKDVVNTTPSVDTLTTTEEVFHTIVDKVEEIDINVSKRIFPIDHTRDENFLDVEPLPMPQMLKKGLEDKERFDYKAKKTERDYKIKVKKLGLDMIIKDAKRKVATKKLPMKPVDTTKTRKVLNDKYISSEEKMGKVNLNKDTTKLDQPFANNKILEPVDKVTVNIKETVENVDDNAMNNDKVREDLIYKSVDDTSSNIIASDVNEETGNIIIDILSSDTKTKKDRVKPFDVSAMTTENDEVKNVAKFNRVKDDTNEDSTITKDGIMKPFTGEKVFVKSNVVVDNYKPKDRLLTQTDTTITPNSIVFDSEETFVTNDHNRDMVNVDKKIIKDFLKPANKNTMNSDVNTEENVEIIDFRKDIVKDISRDRVTKSESDKIVATSEFNTVDSEGNLNKMVSENDIVRVDKKVTKDRKLKPVTKDVVTIDETLFDSKENVEASRESVELGNQDINNDSSVEENVEVPHTDSIRQDSVEEDPILLLEVVKDRNPTMYDYLMRTVDSDIESAEIKVQE